MIAVNCLGPVASTFAQNDSPEPMLFQAIRRGDDTLLRSLLREGHSTTATLDDGGAEKPCRHRGDEEQEDQNQRRAGLAAGSVTFELLFDVRDSSLGLGSSGGSRFSLAHEEAERRQRRGELSQLVLRQTDVVVQLGRVAQPIGLAVVTAMIARFGPEAVAGFGVASRIESLVLVIYYAMSAVIGPFVGQNLAAGKEDRIQLSLRLCASFCIASGLVIAAVLALMSGFLPTLFSSSEEVIGVTRLFLWIAPISYGTYGIVMVVNAAFNGLGNPMPGVVISVTRILVLYVPLAMVGMHFFGVIGIFAAYAVANILSGILGYIWARNNAHRLCEIAANQPAG